MLNMKNIAVFGIFKDRVGVESAVSQLKAQGFRNTDVSVLMPESISTREFAHEKGTKAPEGTVAGVSTGAILGGTLGWLVGAGALAIPVIGPLVAAGPLLGLLAGASAGGALGGIAGALIGMGIPEYEAKRYEGFVKEGGILLSVHADNREWADKAEKLLKEVGAKDVSSAGEERVDVLKKKVS